MQTQFKIGDRVYFNRPGRDYGIKGTVAAYDANTTLYTINWDGGGRNFWYAYELKPILNGFKKLCKKFLKKHN